MVERTAVHSSPQNSALLAALLADDCVHDIDRITRRAIISGFSGSMQAQCRLNAASLLGSIDGAATSACFILHLVGFRSASGLQVNGGEEAGGCWRLLEAGGWSLPGAGCPGRPRLPLCPLPATLAANVCLDMLGYAWTGLDERRARRESGGPWTGLDSVG